MRNYVETFYSNIIKKSRKIFLAKDLSSRK